MVIKDKEKIELLEKLYSDYETMREHRKELVNMVSYLVDIPTNVLLMMDNSDRNFKINEYRVILRSGTYSLTLEIMKENQSEIIRYNI